MARKAQAFLNLKSMVKNFIMHASELACLPCHDGLAVGDSDLRGPVGFVYF